MTAVWRQKKIAQIHCLAIFFIIIDRLAKAWSWQIKPAFDGWLSWHYSLNDNLALSLPLNNSLIIIITAIIILWLWFIYVQKTQQQLKPNSWLIMVILGATSNWLDRFFYGGVIDYINFASLTIFNLADILIIVGLLGLAGRKILNHDRSTTAKSSQSES